MKKIISILLIVAVIAIGGYYYKSNNQAKNNTQNETKQENITASTTMITANLSTIALHNKPADCWTTINGKIYNLTAFASKHPGGDKAIFSICGIDGSKAFNGQHGGQEKPEMTLKGFDIGTLIK